MPRAFSSSVIIAISALAMAGTYFMPAGLARQAGVGAEATGSDEIPGQASIAARSFSLPDPDQNAQLDRVLSTLAEQPDSPGALAQLDELLSEVLAQAQVMGDQGNLEQMAQLLRVIGSVNPQKSGLESARQELETLQHAERWLRAAELALSENRLIEPRRDSAAHYFHRVREVQPENELAIDGLRRVQSALLERAWIAAEELDFERAEEWLGEAAASFDEQFKVDEARMGIEDYQKTQANRIEQGILDLVLAGQFNRAEIQLIDLIALGGSAERIASLRQRIEDARIYGNHLPGEILQDEITGSVHLAPPVVVIAAGSFLMGAADGEPEASEDEYPQHRVTIARGFALGQKEVTVAEFRVFVESTGHQTQAESDGDSAVYDERTGRLLERPKVNWRHDYAGEKAGDDAPVLHIALGDALAYVNWLAERTRKAYRLPSEAEFEYALRAGSVASFWWGEGSPQSVVENLTGDADTSPRNRNWSVAFEGYSDGHWGPASSGSFTSNPFGLHDMAGNVSEWVADCWHASYAQAPDDGSAWTNPGCERQVVRGGYWAGAPAQARSAARLFAAANLHGPRVGFRVARDL
jgi:formylglycine-generating enzyme required for sulfatase activity